jgi:GMP synthase (glutamine-hydrolysing)
MGYRAGLPAAGEIVSDGRYVLIVLHVSWEAPGAIAAAFEGLPIRTINIAADPAPALPSLDQLAGLVVMGGPMAADDVAGYPGLAAERQLLEDAASAGVPTLGVCLGAQLLGLALGAELERGASPELGWAPVEVHARADPMVGKLVDDVAVLHWHADAISLPPGADLLASTWTTPVQAFRKANAWGLQFHIEVTNELMTDWLNNDVMSGEARAALGSSWERALLEQTAAALPALEVAGRGAFGHFAELTRALTTQSP